MFDNFEDDALEEDFDFEEEQDEAPEEGGNRNFIWIAGGLGVVTLAIIVCVVVYSFLGGNNRNQRATEIAEAYSQQTQVAFAAQETAQAAAATKTPTNTPLPTDTPEPTKTPVVARATSTQEPTEDPRTATVAALLTQAAGATIVATSTAFATALPDTGFVEDVGIPGLFALAALAVVVIFLVRRMRTSPE